MLGNPVKTNMKRKQLREPTEKRFWVPSYQRSGTNPRAADVGRKSKKNAL